MDTIGGRLKAERLRLEKTQEEFAVIGKIQRRGQIRYESNERCPDGHYLAAIAAAGADVNYILTGVRASAHSAGPASPLTPREAALLDNYRHSSDAARDALDKTSAAFAQPATQVKDG